MGTITAATVLNRAAKTLLDETGVTWARTELLDYLNAAITAIVAAKPDVYTLNQPFTLAAGSKQQLPLGGIQILDCVRNLGANGTTPGTVIRQVERSALDHSNPEWHVELGQKVLHFVADKRDPRTFYIYPTVSGAWNIELVFAAHPPRITVDTTVLPIDDLYENPLHAYVVGYAYAKNSKRQDLNKMQGYMAIFAQSIGTKSQVQFAIAPVPADVDEATDR